MKKIITLVAIAALLIGCGKSKKEAQIQGKVEKEQISIVSKIPGKIVQLLVKEGDLVKKGDTLCIIEAMKLMNEIESDYNGKIEKILVEDGQPVEYGTPLFEIA